MILLAFSVVSKYFRQACKEKRGGKINKRKTGNLIPDTRTLSTIVLKVRVGGGGSIDMLARTLAFAADRQDIQAISGVPAGKGLVCLKHGRCAADCMMDLLIE